MFNHKFVHTPCTFKQEFVRTLRTFKHRKRICTYLSHIQGLHDKHGLYTFEHKFVHTQCTFKQKFVRTLFTFKQLLKKKIIRVEHKKVPCDQVTKSQN